ncbi:MAG: hypothetical protein ABW220_15005 [Burkholderiaceae bacterium]
MSEAKHTPGPWTYFPKEKYAEHHVSVPLPGRTFKQALFPDGCPTANAEADARLIAAAPELLEAAQAAWNCIAELSPTQARVEVVQMLHAAIAKAEGGAQ